MGRYRAVANANIGRAVCRPEGGEWSSVSPGRQNGVPERIFAMIVLSRAFDDGLDRKSSIFAVDFECHAYETERVHCHHGIQADG